MIKKFPLWNHFMSNNHKNAAIFYKITKKNSSKEKNSVNLKNREQNNHKIHYLKFYFWIFSLKKILKTNKNCPKVSFKSKKIKHLRMNFTFPSREERNTKNNSFCLNVYENCLVSLEIWWFLWCSMDLTVKFQGLKIVKNLIHDFLEQSSTYHFFLLLHFWYDFILLFCANKKILSSILINLMSDIYCC